MDILSCISPVVGPREASKEFLERLRGFVPHLWTGQIFSLGSLGRGAWIPPKEFFFLLLPGDSVGRPTILSHPKLFLSLR